MRLAGPLLAALILAACGNSADDGQAPAGPRPTLGLMSSLPIMWSGNDAFASLAGAGENAPHWAVAVLEQDFRLDPLDTLSSGTLAQVDVLLLAQPRVLAPAENVALDDWVRAGGRALVLADPRLVGEYPLPPGDPRRPLDSALLSPILARWGLELTQDERAPALQVVPLGRARLAVAAGGQFRLRPSGSATCLLTLAGVAAQCAVGAGRVVLLADATLLEDPVGGEGSPEALRALLGMVRETNRDIAGKPGP